MYPVGYDPNNFVCKAGERYKPEYRGVPQENGMIELIIVGTIDLWEMHQADAESCDINNIVARFQNGDVSALASVQGSYLDVAGLPKDLRGMHDLIDNMRNSYESMSEDKKSKFASFNDWLEKAGTDYWMNVMSPVEQSAEHVASSESEK